MKRTRIFLILITLIGGHIIISCDKEQYHGQQPAITGQIIKNSTCKNNFKLASENPVTPDTLSCTDYSYDSQNNKLTLKHINAGFNCCPEKLYCNVSLSKDTIIIHEFEKEALCDCNCLYDLDIEITGVVAKKYHIKFIEPYCGEQPQLIFEIDLSEETEGLFCVTRKRYPWGIYNML
jgi:hypothetical protein